MVGKEVTDDEIDVEVIAPVECLDCHSLDVVPPERQYLRKISGQYCDVGRETLIRRACHTFLHKNALQQRVFIPQHQALVGSAAMTLLQCAQCLFVEFDGSFQLLDVFSPSLAKSRLGLSIPLFTFLRSGIDLYEVERLVSSSRHPG